MNMMKALIPSTILTLILSALVGPSGSGGGFLNFQDAEIGGFVLYWSWTFFFTAMTINGLILLSMARKASPAHGESADEAEEREPPCTEPAEGKA